MTSVAVGPAESTRETIISAAIDLVESGGRKAASTRAVCAAAGVQAPTIYRLFGDKQGLLDAVVAQGFALYLTDKSIVAPTADPVEDLRHGWDLHVDFALAHPSLYSLMYAERDPGVTSPAAEAAWQALAALIHRIAQAGQLCVAEQQATQLIHAAGSGVAQTLIALPIEARDTSLSALAREAAIAAITNDAKTTHDAGSTSAAISLRATLPLTSALTSTERALLDEWLDRIIEHTPETGHEPAPRAAACGADNTPRRPIRTKS